MKLRIPNLTLPLGESPAPGPALEARVAETLGVAPEAIVRLEVLRRSLDARGRRQPRWTVTVGVEVEGAVMVPAGVQPWKPQPRRAPEQVSWEQAPPLIVGAGPAGLFCALALAEAGVPSVVLERGRPVDPRKKDVTALYREGRLDPESNVSFGEGGAGTFTDGKLSTRVRDGAVREVLEVLVAHGADPDILVTNKPHLGSERLPGIIDRMRRHLEALGVTFAFDHRVTDLSVTGGRVSGVILSDGTRMESEHVILAPGNAGRELFEALARHPGVLEAKPFAVGLRVEHPQALLNEIQYGRYAGHPDLPTAEYKLAGKGGDGRGVYAFCMCPGGVVVPTPTIEEALCVNGMSNSHRSSRWANSALVVQVGAGDFAAAGHGEDVLAGVRFQEDVERRAYAAGGGAFRAPATDLAAFARGKPRLGPDRRTSYPRGLAPGDPLDFYPAPVVDALRDALSGFDKTLRGFVTDEALLIGAETRTSSPVAVPRGPDLMSPALPGLYPCGEGCGHAGGIVSAAIDGLRVARVLCGAPTR